MSAAAKVQPSEQRSIALTELQASLVDQLVERMAKRTGETPEQVRRGVEVSILTRGIAAVQEELGAT